MLRGSSAGAIVLDLKDPVPRSDVSPAMVAECVIDGIANNKSYIASHLSYAPIVEKRLARIRRAGAIVTFDLGCRQMISINGGLNA